MKRYIEFSHSLFNKINKLIFNKEVSIHSYNQFLRYLIIAGGGALLNYSLFNILKYFNFGTIIANTMVNIIVIITTFIGQKYYTYRVKENTGSQALLFIIQSIVYYLVDTSILVYLIDYLKISAIFSKLVSLSILSFLSFLFQKYVIFKVKIKRGEIFNE